MYTDGQNRNFQSFQIFVSCFVYMYVSVAHNRKIIISWVSTSRENLLMASTEFIYYNKNNNNYNINNNNNNNNNNNKGCLRDNTFTLPEFTTTTTQLRGSKVVTLPWIFAPYFAPDMDL